MNEKNKKKPIHTPEELKEANKILTYLTKLFFNTSLHQLKELATKFNDKYHNNAGECLIIAYCNTIIEMLDRVHMDITKQPSLYLLQYLQQYTGSNKPDEKIEVV